MPKALDLHGQRFTRWSVVKFHGSSPNKRGTLWDCRCDCGTERVVTAALLRSGGSRSCGCLQREATSAAHRKHGHASGYKVSSEYAIWHAMLQRCRNPNHPAFDHYGGRGITVCERWSEFPNFFADMGPRPTTKHSLDRTDNDEGYSPENCRWVTWDVQGKNKRNSRLITWNGRTETATTWATVVGIPARTIAGRLARGWDAERILTTPPQAGGHNMRQTQAPDPLNSAGIP